MKSAFAILFMLALVLNQPLAASVACAQPANACCACNGTKKCCMSDSKQTDREAPAVPAPNVSQKDFSTVVWLAVRVSAPLAPPDNRVAAADLSAASLPVVPLFTRDCAFLI